MRSRTWQDVRSPSARRQCPVGTAPAHLAGWSQLRVRPWWPAVVAPDVYVVPKVVPHEALGGDDAEELFGGVPSGAARDAGAAPTRAQPPGEPRCGARKAAGLSEETPEI